jgi:hypothetical protein
MIGGDMGPLPKITPVSLSLLKLDQRLKLSGDSCRVFRDYATFVRFRWAGFQLHALKQGLSVLHVL